MRLNVKSETAAGIVAVAAFVASAGHIVTVVDATNPIQFALVYPIGIDGLIFVGIRAMQAGRKPSGAVALLIGAFYSLAFNAHAENALEMPPLMIAASMPICMFAAIIIESLGHRPADRPSTDRPSTDRPSTDRPSTVQPSTDRPSTDRPSTDRPSTDRPSTDRPSTVHDRPSTVQRTVRWDVEKTVQMILDGRVDGDILAAVSGLGAKPLQRTRRAARMIGRGDDDATVAAGCGISVALVARVRQAAA